MGYPVDCGVSDWPCSGVLGSDRRSFVRFAAAAQTYGLSRLRPIPAYGPIPSYGGTLWPDSHLRIPTYVSFRYTGWRRGDFGRFPLSFHTWTADSHLAARTWTCLGPLRCSRACRTAADGTRSPKQSVRAPLETAAERLRQTRRQACAQDNTRERRHATHETPSDWVGVAGADRRIGLKPPPLQCDGCVQRRPTTLRPTPRRTPSSWCADR
jgi:hypothetical protein